jgi:hypothetical protein
VVEDVATGPEHTDGQGFTPQGLANQGAHMDVMPPCAGWWMGVGLAGRRVEEEA